MYQKLMSSVRCFTMQNLASEKKSDEWEKGVFLLEEDLKDVRRAV